MKDIIKNIYNLTFSIVALFGALFGMHYYIDYKIEKQIHSPETIRQMASIFRPSLIFSLKGSVVYDMGGMDMLLEPPKVIKLKENKGIAIWSVIISPKESLKIAPLIECINEGYVIQSERGSGNLWEYTLEDIGIVVWRTAETKTDPLFRLEIIN